jgi:hypothetical protein
MVKFAKAFPEDVVRIVEMEENPEEKIYRLNDKILVKEQMWL